MSAAKLPNPLVPAEVDLRSLEYMPLYIAPLLRSKAWLVTKRKPMLMRPLLALWIAAWQGSPAGSLEDDDDVLAHATELPFDDFQEMRDDLLRGWKRCSDGRLYLPSMVPMVERGWALVQSRRKKGRAGAAARWGKSAAMQDASGNASGIPSEDSREGGREGGSERKGSATRASNGKTDPRDAMLNAMTAIRNRTPPEDPIAQAVIDDLGGLEQLHAKTGSALADAMRDFENRYKTRQREAH